MDSELYYAIEQAAHEDNRSVSNFIAHRMRTVLRAKVAPWSQLSVRPPEMPVVYGDVTGTYGSGVAEAAKYTVTEPVSTKDLNEAMGLANAAHAARRHAFVEITDECDDEDSLGCAECGQRAASPIHAPAPAIEIIDAERPTDGPGS